MEKKSKIILICRACGSKTEVNYVHKLTDYIIKKNPTLKKVADKSKPKLNIQSNDPTASLKKFWSQNPSNDDILSQVKVLQSHQGWNSDQLLRFIFGSLFDRDILTDIHNKINILQLFIVPESQSTVLFCVEKLCTMEKSLIPCVSKILENFYENKILDAKSIKEWFGNSHPKIDKTLALEIRNSARSLVDTLNE